MLSKPIIAIFKKAYYSFCFFLNLVWLWFQRF